MLPLAPDIAAGTALGISDVLAKSFSPPVVTRSLMPSSPERCWRPRLRPNLASLRQAHAARARDRVIGVLFTGLIDCLFEGDIEAIDVSTAVLSCMVDGNPLLTGLGASLLGLSMLRWKASLCAMLAFFGLALMLRRRYSPPGLLASRLRISARRPPDRDSPATRAYLIGFHVWRTNVVFDEISSTGLLLLFRSHPGLESAGSDHRLGLSGHCQPRG